MTPRIMTMVNEPGTRRFFASDMFGKLYAISYDGKTVTPYLDLTLAKWEVDVQAMGRERGLQSFAFHPQFGERGSRGFGKFYTVDGHIEHHCPCEFQAGRRHAHARHGPAGVDCKGSDRCYVRWQLCRGNCYRIEQPFANHNGGHLTFNPLAKAGDADFGLLYMGFADGGSAGDPINNAQNLSSIFGKILRLDPLGNNSSNKKYGIPPSNPFAGDNNPGTLGEIYAYGVRNPQRLFWDPKNRNMFMSDIGQNTVEEISPVSAGANLGWNIWEGASSSLQGDLVASN